MSKVFEEKNCTMLTGTPNGVGIQNRGGNNSSRIGHTWRYKQELASNVNGAHRTLDMLELAYFKLCNQFNAKYNLFHMWVSDLHMKTNLNNCHTIFITSEITCFALLTVQTSFFNYQ